MVNIPVTAENANGLPPEATKIQDSTCGPCLNDQNMTVNTPIEVLSLNDGKNYDYLFSLKAGDRQGY